MLDVQDTGLGGTLPQGLAYVRDLRYLDLDGLQLTVRTHTHTQAF